MATVNILPAFTYKWAQDATVEAIDDAQYKAGWAFIGATPPSVEQFNKVHQVADEKANYLYAQMAAIFTAAGQTPSAGDTGTLLASILNQIRVNAGAPRVQGLVGNTASTVQYAMSADAVTFRNPSNGAIFTVLNIATKTADITIAGPSASGRDQVGTFTANQWIHFYFVYNGTNVGLTASSALPSTGPALPTGYTSWAYAGSVYLTSVFPGVRMRGAWATYDSPPTVVSGGSATVDTPFSTATAVPPNALEWKMISSNLALSASGTGAYGLTLFVDSYQAGLQGQGAASAVVSISGGSYVLPNTGQSASYRLNLATGSGPTTSVQAGGYKMPNGGE